MKLNPSIKNMSNEYIFFTDQTALTFRICLVFYESVQTDLGANPASHTMGTGSLPGVKRPGRGLDTHPHLATSLKEE